MGASGRGVRFDDRLATVLAQPEADNAAVIAKWRQLLDLLAQRDGLDSGPDVERALAFLREERRRIPQPVLDALRATGPARINPQVEPLFAQPHSAQSAVPPAA